VPLSPPSLNLSRFWLDEGLVEGLGGVWQPLRARPLRKEGVAGGAGERARQVGKRAGGPCSSQR